MRSSFRSPPRVPAAVLAAVALATLLAAVLVPLVPSTSAGPSTASAGLSGSVVPAVPAVTCNKVTTPTPSALLVQLKEPQNLSVGGLLGYQMELRVVNYTNGTAPVNLTFPYVYFDFPLATGGEFTTTFLPQNVTINASGWYSPPALERLAKASKNLSFAPNATARMTTQKFAVMTSGAYGSVLLDVQWRWLEEAPGSTTLNHSPWSFANPKSHWPTDNPSEFFPAAYVLLAGTSNATQFVGDNFTLTIAGPNVGGQWFYQELEHPGSGHVVEGYPVTAPAGATSFGVGVPLLNYVHFLVPGPYLAHVHDECGALLFSKTVNAVFAPVANITFALAGGCGNIVFNGTSYANGSVGQFVPSVTNLFSVKPHGCAGHPFAGYTLTGGLKQFSTKEIRVSSSGTLTMNFA